MTDKELRRLGRPELIEIIYQLEKSQEESRQEIARLQARLQDRTLRLSEAGSIAQAALQVNGVMEAAQAAADQYTLIANPKDGCTFEIGFKENVLKPNDVVIVTYSATLNDKAVIHPEPNTNETKLVYGEGSETTWDKTETFTYQFDLVKTKTDKTVLDGAEFKLYDAKTEGNEIALIDESNGVYRVATAAEKAAEGFVSATIKAGKVTIKGLDSGTYYLEETKAPAGYNVLAERVEVKIDHANLTATVEGDTYVSGGVQVINQTGAELPSTGGIGTTIFYVVGGLLVVAAGVLLVTRKRMSKSED